MPNREGFEGNDYFADKMEVQDHDIRQAADERSGHADMSLDFSVFGMRPPARPTINR